MAYRGKIMEKHKHLPLGSCLVAQCSMGPVGQCRECGRKLFNEKSIRSGGKEWWIVDDFKHRHFKSKCKVIPLKVGIDGKPFVKAPAASGEIITNQ